MSNTPETEVVRMRIEGMVAFPPNLALTPKELQADLTLFLNGTYDGNALISVAKDPDPTGFALYKVEEVEGYKAEIKDLYLICKEKDEKERANNEVTKRLAEELAQERESVKRWKDSYKLLEAKFNESEWQRGQLSKVISGLEKVIELEQDTNWKRFIKWCKGLWKN